MIMLKSRRFLELIFLVPSHVPVRGIRHLSAEKGERNWTPDVAAFRLLYETMIAANSMDGRSVPFARRHLSSSVTCWCDQMSGRPR